MQLYTTTDHLTSFLAKVLFFIHLLNEMNHRGRAFPLHIGGPLHRSIHRREDGTIPVVFKSSPASLNRIIFTMVWRIIDQYNTYTCLMAKFNHASDKLCAMT